MFFLINDYSSEELRGLEIGKFANKFPLHIFHLYLFINNKPAISRRTVGWGTLNSRWVRLEADLWRTPRLSQTGLRISRLGSAYQF